MRLRWINLLDSELPFEFAIVPLTGHLVRRPLAVAEKQALGRSWLHRVIGWWPGLRMSEELSPDIENILDPEPHACDKSEQAAAALLSRAVVLLLKYLPLLWAIRLADCLPAPPGLQRCSEKALVTGKLAQLFGRRTHDQCLRMAMERRTYLRWMGMQCQIRIGVFIPTEEMHAWVEINNQPLFESPDFLVHYRVALTID